MTAAALRPAGRSDLDVVVDIWVDAFATDPFFRWIQPAPDCWPEFGRAWMTLIASATLERGHTYLAGSLDAAVAWVPPDVSLLTPESVNAGRKILAKFGGERRAEEAFATIMAARSHDLATPHWTLQYLGVRANARGSGLGARVVAPMLATIDDEGWECGLVSTNARNVSFYERLGFTVIAEVESPEGTVTLRPMQRARRQVRKISE